MTNDPLPTPRPWRCITCGLPLGYIERSGNIRQLRLSASITGMTIVVVGLASITCTCGATREWVAAEDGMDELLNSLLPK